MNGFHAHDMAEKKSGFDIPIRELMQNSIDASSKEIKIYAQPIRLNEVSCLDDYKAAVKKAVKTQQECGGYNDIAENVVKNIKTTLANNTIKTVVFVDNGSGMNKESIEALIEGRSRKDDSASAAGSFGYGHMASFYLSSLRYVLYASKYQNAEGITQQLFTGLCHLAGFKDKDAQRSGLGRIVRQMPKNEKDPQFSYPQQFPNFINHTFESTNNPTGSLVCILGLDEDFKPEDILLTIASNFFAAIIFNNLSVEINNDGGATKFDKKDIDSILTKYKDRSKKPKNGIISPQLAYESFLAIRNEKPIDIQLDSNNSVEVYLRHKVRCDSGIVLIRNGMVIARHDSALLEPFNDLRKSGQFENFIAVVNLKENTKIYNLIKGAESPHHDKLEKKRLPEDEAKQLQKLIKSLSDKIKEQLNPINTDPYELSLFSIQEFHGNAPISVKTRRIDPHPSPPPRICPECGQQKPCQCPCKRCNQHPCICPHSSKPRPQIDGRKLKCSIGSSKPKIFADRIDITINIQIEPTSDYKTNDKIYFALPVAEDNDQNRMNSFFAEILTISVDGKEIPESEYLTGRQQVNIGRLTTNNTYTIEASIKKPNIIGDMLPLAPIFNLRQR